MSARESHETRKFRGESSADAACCTARRSEHAEDLANLLFGVKRA